MPRPTPYERARMWVAKMPPAISDNGGHSATFSVSMVLMQGFDLARHEARAILDEYNQRCEPPWSDRELEHKLNQADKQPGFTTQSGIQPRGFLRDQGGEDDREEAAPANAPAPKPAPPKPQFNLEKLERAAGKWASTVDLVWLANRSPIDPALVHSAKFLSTLYKPGEKVLVFTNDKTQGEAVWPADALPTTGKLGVWFLCQPVTGEFLPNPRGKVGPDGSIPPSRRIEECVTDWRFMVLESDKAPPRLWLAALAQLPLRIAAIYTSGGRSIHALVRIDALTKAAWDEAKHAMKAGLIILGADPGAMSAVRLSRLPGTTRQGKLVEKDDGKKVYERFPAPAPQKLLYLNPEAPLRPLVDMLCIRDVENDWLKLSYQPLADADTTGGQWIKDGLAYYAKVSTRLREALTTYGTPEHGKAKQKAQAAPAIRYAVLWIGPDSENPSQPASYLKRVWEQDPRTRERRRVWEFEEDRGDDWPTEEAALAAYVESGYASEKYVQVISAPWRR